MPNSVTRQVSFKRTKICLKMPKFIELNTIFWVIFKHCVHDWKDKKKREINQIHFILYVFCQIPYNTVGGGQIFLRPSKRGHINFWPSSQIGTVSFFLPVCESSSSHTSQFPVSENHRKSLIQYYERSSEEFLSTYFCASIALSLFLPSAKDSKKHGV